MEKVVIVVKPIGATPLQAIEDFKKKNPKYESVTISYAGRLDPMAEGLLVLLIGEENKKRKKYEGLKKEYNTEIVLGISTDTYDVLGIIERVCLERTTNEKLLKTIKKLKETRLQKYPPYSSKTVAGKPLYWWARRKRISEIELPEREIEIYDIEVLDFAEIEASNLVEEIEAKISLVVGDFRQKEILDGWDLFRKKNKNRSFQKLKLKVRCSSGTYIRTLAFDIGKRLGVGAMCLSIKRTKVGEFTISQKTIA